MTVHTGSVQDVAHRMRVAAHQATAYVDALTGCQPFERADLRQFIAMVAEAADQLSPVCSTVLPEEQGNVVHGRFGR